MYTKTPKKIYLRSGGDIYYLNLRNPVTGQVIRKSSKTSDYDEALMIWEKEQKKLEGLGAHAKLSDILTEYIDQSSNPRMKQAMINGSSYGVTHAQIVARHARQLSELLSRKAPKLYSMEMADFTVLHIKTIKELLIKEFGHCRKSQQMFTNLKTFFSQAHEDGIIFASPCVGLSDIQYTAEVREAMPTEALRLLLSERDCMDREYWNFIAIAITTGMRRSEIMALNKEQVLDGGKALLIDRAVKDNSGAIGLPKANVTRVIPLSKFTQAVIAEMRPDGDGRFFAGMTWSGFSHFFGKKVKAFMKMKYPQLSNLWTVMSCHVFRHSLFSNLICNGANQLLAEEYLSWTHQNLRAMPANYLHIYARNMQPIADLIDELYAPTHGISGLRLKA